ncbi:MAG: DNA repair photolyase [Candidatus Marinimicrobia bacterium]|nr:DNA repair photolyase [Candidatus Neomarinimicrobiota bacterium]
MQSESKFLPDFSHIYIESKAQGFNLTKKCIRNFPKAKIIEISDYKSIFNRPRQDFQTQKQSMKLILAIKKPPYIYKGTDILQDGGYKNFYYNTPMLNCLYNCSYCFLQGMYSSANIVVFVNEIDMQDAVKNEIVKRVHKEQPLMLSISYNTDLMAFENILPITKNWIQFAKLNLDLNLEIRTKSGLYHSIKDIESSDQIVLAWTLSPDKVVRKYELNTPPLSKRISAIKLALNDGWKVRLCFDPILYYNNWENDYLELFNKVKSSLNLDQVLDITVGTFRMSNDYFNRIRKSKPNSGLFYQNYKNENGIVSIDSKKKNSIFKLVSDNFSNYLPQNKIHYSI